MSLSFRFRIALWSALLSRTVLIAFLGYTSNMVRKTMTEEADYELKGFTADMVLTAQAMEEGGLLQTQLVGTLSAERAEVRLIELAEIEISGSTPMGGDTTGSPVAAITSPVLRIISLGSRGFPVA